jgi:Protein of unknown function (DUF2971)
MTEVEPSSAELTKHYEPLWEIFLSKENVLKRDHPPLLAHYTSIAVMEKILKHGEIWFSNPIFMNDLQEMRFGLSEGAMLFSDHDLLKRAGVDDNRAAILQYTFSHFFDKFVNEGALDIYVFCLSEHKKDDNDGLLSMWRGYGHHGSGVALVFNPANITDVPESPLFVSKVLYSSDIERQNDLRNLLDKWATITADLNLNDDHLFIASYMALYLFKYFSLIYKHPGFIEENEWRIIYDSERDHGGLLKDSLSYQVGDRGVEPKLKYKVEHVPGVTAADISLDKILYSIILGPSSASPLAVRSVERMLEKIEKPNLKPLIRASGIPLRPLSGSSF